MPLSDIIEHIKNSPASARGYVLTQVATGGTLISFTDLMTDLAPFIEAEVQRRASASSPIKTGDVVQLKSGGPSMTVGRVGPQEESEHLEALPDGACVCAWFPELPCPPNRSGDEPLYGDALRGVFHVDMLDKAG